MTKVRYQPIQSRILIELDETPTKMGRLFIADETRGRLQKLTQTAKVLALGSDAFASDKGYSDDQKPQVGDNVLIVKHGGAPVPQQDLQRVINDIDILAIERVVA
jgi:co-chaperonin GroES (HSP10)